MSLINEALKQARVEAARQDAAGKGVPAEALPRYVPERRRSWLAPIVGFIAGLVAVGVAAGAFWMVRGPAQDPEGGQAQHAPEVGQAPHAAEGRQAEQASGEGQAQDAAAGQPAERRPEREPARQAQAAPATQPTERATEARSQTPPTGSGTGGNVQLAGASESALAPVEMVPVETVPMEVAPVAQPSPTGGAGDQDYLRQATLAGTTVKLDFIVWSDDPFAQINGHLLSAGQSVDGYTLLEVERERVELEGGGERFWIRVK